MSYIFISHYLHEELDAFYEKENSFKKEFTRSVRVITDGPDEDGWVRTRGCSSEWWIDPVEYPELKVVYIYE